MRNYARGLLSGYFVLAVNVVYSLIAVRLAWEHLPESEFGVWTVCLMVAGYLQFIDLGMGSATARLLIDCKDDRAGGLYGGMIKTASLVFFVQGLLVFVCGAALSLAAPATLKIPNELRDETGLLLLGLVGVSAVQFPGRIFSLILFARQRLDLQHGAECVQFVFSLALLWHGFRSGWGVFSLLAAQVGGMAVSVFLCGCFCLICGFLPRRGEWGKSSRQQFREIFSFGTSLFWIQVATRFIRTSHAVVLARALGGEAGVAAAGVWAVTTKAFMLARQMAFKSIDMATPVLGEMHARNESARLRDRYRTLFCCANALAVWSAIVFAFANASFLSVWMGGEVAWAPHHDWLLALWLVVLVQQGHHGNLILARKQIGHLKTVVMVEAIAFIAGGVLYFGREGMDMPILWSLICTLVCSFAYGNWRVGRMNEVGARELLWKWQKPGVAMAAVLLPVGWGLDVVSRDAPEALEFLVKVGGLGTLGAVIFGRMVLPGEFRAKLIQMSPSTVRPFLTCICGKRIQGQS